MDPFGFHEKELESISTPSVGETEAQTSYRNHRLNSFIHNNFSSPAKDFSGYMDRENFLRKTSKNQLISPAVHQKISLHHADTTKHHVLHYSSTMQHNKQERNFLASQSHDIIQGFKGASLKGPEERYGLYAHHETRRNTNAAFTISYTAKGSGEINPKLQRHQNEMKQAKKNFHF